MALSIRTQRVPLTADVSWPVYPPVASRVVRIGNGGSDDLKVYSTDGDDLTYFVVLPGYERELDLKQARFDTNTVAFYLKSPAAGTAVLIWS